MRHTILCLAAAAVGLHATAQSVAVRLDARALARELDAQLAAAPPSFAGAPPEATAALPWFGGGELEVRVHEASQFAPPLRARYPEIRSYRVTGPGEMFGRLNFSPDGAYGYLVDGGDTYRLAPAGQAGDYQLSVVDVAAARDFTCDVGARAGAPSRKTRGGATAGFAAANGCFRVGDQLRRFRIALTNTTEFAAKHGGNVAGVNAAFNNRLAELNAIYERELAITFELIAQNDALINISSDPFTMPNNTVETLPQVRNEIETTLGDQSLFDIGHGLHEKGPLDGVAGRAALATVCKSSKALGYSILRENQALVVMQHEIGHQLNAYHTNYGCGTGGPGDASNTQRYEPGQGVTIMGTPQNCTSADGYAVSDDTYFHVGSLQAIEDYLAGPGGCFATVASANTAPDADAVAGNPAAAGAYAIPARTAFTLVARGGDADGDALTYNWESFDTDQTTSLPPGGTANSLTAPLFRSFAPGPDPQRYFPALGTILSGVAPDGSTGEILPAADRSLAFRLTVRDGNGGVACDAIALDVHDTGSPFAITSLNSPTTLTADGTTTETITWDVSGTDVAPISTPAVDVVLSTDGGQTFSYVIASGVPNDGAETFVVPAFATTRGRILVQGSGNVFLDVNDADITIQTSGNCEATPVAIAPARGVIAPAGDAGLDLGLSPQFGTALTPPLAFTLDVDDPNGPLVLRDGSGACAEFNSGNEYDAAYTVFAEADATFTFNSSGTRSSGDFIPVVSVFERDYLSDCTNFVNSTRELSAGTIGGNGFTNGLAAGIPYVLVGFGGNGDGLGTIDLSYSGGTLYDGVPPPDPTSYSYTYAIVEVGPNGPDNIIAFDPSADLSDAGAFPAGDYNVHGVSYETGTDLAAYEGDSFQAFRDAAAAQAICARASANAVAVTIENSLPVELAGLSAEALPAGNRVAWTSAVEVDVASFTVERSGDGAEWEPIGEEAPRGSGSAYATLDADAPAGTSYYRLATRDRDGSLEHSRLVSATRAAPGAAALAGPAVVPNPSAAGTTLALLTPAGQGGDYAVHVADASGRTVYSATRALAAGQRAELPLRLPPGLYLATFARGPERTQTRFTVAR